MASAHLGGGVGMKTGRKTIQFKEFPALPRDFREVGNPGSYQYYLGAVDDPYGSAKLAVLLFRHRRAKADVPYMSVRSQFLRNLPVNLALACEQLGDTRLPRDDEEIQHALCLVSA